LKTIAAEEGDIGRICNPKSLDHERHNSYDFTVVASDRGGEERAPVKGLN
jgi:hypothetical protein